METQTVTGVFSAETIDLPSKGLLYPEDSPLRSGQIEIYYMTAKHEDILSSQNLIQKGVVLDRLVDALIATKGVKSSDLLVGDLNAVMIAARILGYGKDYEVMLECPACKNTVEQSVNLSELNVINQPTGDTHPIFKIVLPISKKELTLKALTRADELTIEKELKTLKKVNSEVATEATTRLKNIIVAVDGDSSKATIWNFVDNMLVKDARYLRENYKTYVPDVDFEIAIECDCGTAQKVRLPIGVNFFWPDA